MRSGTDIFSEKFLIERPILQALRGGEAPPVLLIDELDRTDEPFEAYLLEVLSEWQVSIPEIGTIKAERPPIVVITSNRTREIHDAVKRRCLYQWVNYPDAQRELEIVRRKAPAARTVEPCGGRRRTRSKGAQPQPPFLPARHAYLGPLALLLADGEFQEEGGGHRRDDGMLLAWTGAQGNGGRHSSRKSRRRHWP